MATPNKNAPKSDDKDTTDVKIPGPGAESFLADDDQFKTAEENIAAAKKAKPSIEVVPLVGVSVTRNGRTVNVKPNEAFEFTKEEIAQLDEIQKTSKVKQYRQLAKESKKKKEDDDQI